MHAHIRNLTLVPLLVASSACNSLNPYACIYETRFVGTSGTSSVAGSGTVVVESLNFRENTAEAQAPGGMTWNIRGQDLAAEPVRLSLRNAGSASQVVKALSFSSASATAFAANSAMQIPAAERDQIFNLLSGNAIVVLELADGTSISVPVAVTERQDWHRPNCS